ncbi:HU family DNA-binding protein [Polyangium aurulentum]|uniref:HU family DNA-binding protein n=1 Tax=Polyangium aurulentum TaxID=2567896 RepID=UPI00146CB49E|nr:HU family DNA-binding protein [Polyangium aurulentum]UQA63237.1 HU family DNA-binding protein [Polyangium aurulentum]
MMKIERRRGRWILRRWTKARILVRMHDIDEPGIDADLPEDEDTAPARRLWTKRLLDREVAMICGLPESTVNSVTAVFLDVTMSAIAEDGKLYLHQFGTFTVKQYKGKALAQHQLGKKVPRSHRQMHGNISKNEVRFAKSRGFRRRLRDMGW